MIILDRTGQNEVSICHLVHIKIEQLLPYLTAACMYARIFIHSMTLIPPRKRHKQVA